MLFAALRFRLCKSSAAPPPLPHITTPMSASQIPNLLSLRGGPRSRGGRGRGRGRSAGDSDHGIPDANARNRKDLDIQSTDTDAAVSRLGAVSLGYLHDPYATLFVAGGGARRMPIINRGILVNCICNSPANTSNRDLYKNHSSRYPYKCLHHTQRAQPAADEANNLPRCRYGYKILPPALPEQAPQPNIPRIRLPNRLRNETANGIAQSYTLKA